MGRPRKSETPGNTRARILKAASEEFGDRGYSAARLEDIGERCDVRRATLFHYFDSKRELYEECASETFAALKQRMIKAFDTMGSGEDALEALIVEYRAFSRQNPSIQKIMLRDALEPAGEGLGILLKEAAPLLRTVERYLKIRGRGRLRNPAALRQAIVTWALSQAVRVSMGSRAADVWGATEYDLELARAMVFK